MGSNEEGSPQPNGKSKQVPSPTQPTGRSNLLILTAFWLLWSTVIGFKIHLS